MALTRQLKPSQLKPGLYDITASFALSNHFACFKCDQGIKCHLSF